MKKIIPFLLAAMVLTACGPTDTPEKMDVPSVENWHPMPCG